MASLNKILAVVVTYNRLELLKRCFYALQQQTFKDFDILIVNNGSTDGTKEWIDSLPDAILKIHQSNVGGAGGFYAGQKYGYDKGYEWIWMMDDDGVPDSKQLDIILGTCRRNNIFLANPLVCNIENNEILSLTGESKFKYQTEEFIKAVTCPFNGTFIHYSVMEAIGFIKKEMFIWGDEVEYRQRARSAGFEMYTITNAIHLHPPIRSTMKRVLPFSKIRVKIKPKRFSKYYYRNLGYLNSTYCSNKTVIADFLSYFTYFLLRCNLVESVKFVNYYLRGVKNEFN